MPARPLAAALATVLLWASSFPLIRLALRDFEPLPLAALRFAIAGALMLAWLAYQRPALPPPRQLARFAGAALISIPLYHLLLNTGQQTVSAGAASFIVNVSPVLTGLLALAFLGERFAGWAWVGMAISFAGIGLIASGQPGGLAFGAGATLVLGAAACQAVFFVVQRPLVATYGAPLCTALVVGLGGLWLLPWLPAAVAQAGRAQAGSVWAVVYLAVLPTAVGTLTWNIAQSHYGASRASVFLYLVPPAAVALAFALTAEVPGLATLVGGALAIAGVMLVNTRGRATAPPRPS